jgi:molybdate transport system substrate-binding protein
MQRIFLNCVLALVGLGAAAAPAADVNVFAAASLADALKAIASPYEKQSGDHLVVNLGASSFLARQIEAGAPADLFFSADEARMDDLAKQGLILTGTRKSRLSNTLVAVVAADSSLPIRSAHDLAGPAVKRLALADPKTVPAGLYAKQYLEQLKLWPALAPKVVPTDNVRAALAAVESGNVEAGMVYKTDAAITRKVKVAFEVPAQDGPAISYPMAVMKETRHPEAARKFLRHLDSPEAGRVFEQFGFIVRP